MDQMCKIMLKAFIQGSHTNDRTKFPDISLIKFQIFLTFFSDVKGTLFYQVNFETLFRPNIGKSIQSVKWGPTKWKEILY